VTMPEPDAELSAVSCFGSVCEAVGNSYPATDEVPVAYSSTALKVRRRRYPARPA